MPNQPYYDGKHDAPRGEFDREQVARLRARAAELGLPVPAAARRQASQGSPTHPNTGADTRPTVVSQRAIGAHITTPHELAISQLDFQALAPTRWWRTVVRALRGPFRR